MGFSLPKEVEELLDKGLGLPALAGGWCVAARSCLRSSTPRAPASHVKASSKH